MASKKSMEDANACVTESIRETLNREETATLVNNIAIYLDIVFKEGMEAGIMKMELEKLMQRSTQ